MTTAGTSQSTSTRVPPHNIEAEESLLGAMLLSKDAAEIAVRIVSAVDFYKPSHRLIFSAIGALVERGDDIDATLVGDELQRSGLLEAVGDPSVFVTLQANVPSVAHTRRYAEIVAGRANDRRLIETGSELVSAGYSSDADRQRDIVDSLSSIASITIDKSSWNPINLRRVTLEEIEPNLMARQDGRYLIYPAKVHSLSGEPEAGKSHLAQAVSAQEIRIGRDVVYIDFETDPASVKGRLLDHGCTDEELAEGFHYIRPEGPLTLADRRSLGELLAGVRPTLVVIDGVAEALALEGLDENSAPDVTAFLQSLPRFCASEGAGVLLLDHPVKDRENQGRYRVDPGPSSPESMLLSR